MASLRQRPLPDLEKVNFDWQSARDRAAAHGDERQTWAYQWPQTHALANALDDIVNCTDRTVLDLGCGRGLLGAHAWRSGSKHVTFSDASAQVLEFVTAALIQNNMDGCEVWQRRWGEKTDGRRFDIILGGDILYRPECQPDLAQDVAGLLQPDGLAIFVDPRRQVEEAWFAYLSQHQLKAESIHHPHAKGTWLKVTRVTR